MRLWDKRLIKVLPHRQLCSQFRECCAIAKSISEKGTPNHILVNRIMDYPLYHFTTYTKLVADEMIKRGYKCDYHKFCEYIKPALIKTTYPWMTVTKEDLFNDWHNERYLKQCLYNLQEKFDSKGISQEEWNKIENMYIGYLLEGVNL